MIKKTAHLQEYFYYSCVASYESVSGTVVWCVLCTYEALAPSGCEGFSRGPIVYFQVYWFNFPFACALDFPWRLKLLHKLWVSS